MGFKDLTAHLPWRASAREERKGRKGRKEILRKRSNFKVLFFLLLFFAPFATSRSTL
jgi:hypothetical protein